MIRPPGRDGVAFSEVSDGDLRGDEQARREAADSLGIDPRWATVRQVHGNEVVRVSAPGERGEADALWTTTRGLPVAVFTADCFGVVVAAEEAVGVAHGGWRGTSSGVVSRLVEEMAGAGHSPYRAAIGPGIGACCFEVGHEVAERFPTWVRSTTWGTTSVDLKAAIRSELDGLEVYDSEECTFHGERFFSHRKSGTLERMAAIGWLR